MKRTIAVITTLIVIILIIATSQGKANGENRVFIPGINKPVINPQLAILQMWTMDSDYRIKDTFHRGDTIKLWVNYDNTIPIEAVLSWRLVGPCGAIWDFNYAIDLPQGETLHDEQVSMIPDTACYGDYVFRFHATLSHWDDYTQEIHFQVTE